MADFFRSVGIIATAGLVVFGAYSMYDDFVGFGPAEAAGFAPDMGGFDGDQTTVTEAAWDELLSVCPDLERFSSDIESVDAALVSTMPTPNHWSESYGWDQWLEFEVRIVTDPKRMPREWRAGGNVLRYMVGAGDRPGVEAYKPVARRICDGEYVTGDSNWYIPHDQMRLVGSL